MQLFPVCLQRYRVFHRFQFSDGQPYPSGLLFLFGLFCVSPVYHLPSCTLCSYTSAPVTTKTTLLMVPPNPVTFSNFSFPCLFLQQFVGGPLSFPPRNFPPFIISGLMSFLFFSPCGPRHPCPVFSLCPYHPMNILQNPVVPCFFSETFLPLEKWAPLRKNITFLKLEGFS